MKKCIVTTLTLLAFGIIAVNAADKPVSSIRHLTKARFVERLKTGKNVTIVALGTSLTADAGKWPDILCSDWLNKEFPGQVTMRNLAVGATASSYPPNTCGLAKAKEAAALKPDVVFIEFAINDAYLPYNISLADSKKNLKEIIAIVRTGNPSVEIILQTMNSVIGPHATSRPKLAEYYQGYRDVAKEMRLLLVDNYPNWLKIMKEDPKRFDSLVPDGIHPNPEGYRQVTFPTLKKALE
jgi:acyl-CoA thioesterase I